MRQTLAGMLAAILMGNIVVASPTAAVPLHMQWRGIDFKGGGAPERGFVRYGQAGVNEIFARSTGRASALRMEFLLAKKPTAPLFLHLLARDDDTPEACPVAVHLNGQSIFAGPNEFPADGFAWKSYTVPADLFRTGQNKLDIVNQADQGAFGGVPWFIVARVALGEANMPPYAPLNPTVDFRVTLPTERVEIPDPSGPNQPATGFKIRGTKGWMWTAEQYLAEIPVLARYKMNFLMNCYLSMFDIETSTDWRSGRLNRWWEPLPEAKKRRYEQVVEACRAHNIEFCFAMHPNLGAERKLRYGRDDDLDQLWQHYAWMANFGVKWFSVCLDDISTGIDARGQARMCNEIYRRLRAIRPDAQLIFCPTFYWGTGDEADACPYLAVLAEELDPMIYYFWTGPCVYGPITRMAAESYRNHVRHPLIIWDNYPVNDNYGTMHLGPVIGRDGDLYKAADGYMMNPLYPQSEINRLPLYTGADYACHPLQYDPAHSIGQAILHLAETHAQRQVLKDLVELYPGMLLAERQSHWNPLFDRYCAIAAMPEARLLADSFIRHVEDVALRLEQAFPNDYKDARRTLAEHLAVLKAADKELFGR